MLSSEAMLSKQWNWEAAGDCEREQRGCVDAATLKEAGLTRPLSTSEAYLTGIGEQRRR